MSINLNYGQMWENAKLYVEDNGGAPTIDVTGDTLTCSSVYADSSKASKFIQVRGGETVTLKVWARMIAGDDAGIAIDYPAAGELRTIKRISSYEWQEYEVTAFIPPNCPEAAYCIAQIGVFGRYDGTAEFKNPKLSKSNSVTGTTQVMAMGLMYFDSTDNTPKINTGFSHVGIYNVSYDQSSKILSITIPKTVRDDPEIIGGDGRLPLLPVVTGDTTTDNAGGAIHIKYGKYNFLTGVVEGEFRDSSGALIDILPLLSSGNIYFTFKAEVS